MGLNSLPAIVEGLLKARPQSLPAAVIENGTWKCRTIWGCLGDIQGKVLEAGLHTPPAGHHYVRRPAWICPANQGGLGESGSGLPALHRFGNGWERC